MKTFMLIALIFGIHITAFSQSTKKAGNDEKAMKPVALPEIVVKNAGTDYSYYLRDENPDLSVRKLESEFIAYNIGNDYEEYEAYLVSFRGGNGLLTAAYDSNGKLTSVVEKYHDIVLPLPIVHSVLKTYPNWQIVGDKYFYSQNNGKITKKEYVLKLKKENETVKVKVNQKGDILTPKGDIIADID